MSLETSRLRITGVTGGPLRITGASLVNGAYELATAGGADYELQTERQTIMDNILFIPGIADPVSEINSLLFGQGQQGAFIAPSLTASLISGSTFGTGVQTLPDLSPRNNPFSQATPSSRGAWFREPKTGRRNLLNATATLSTQSVTVAAVQKTLSFRGTGTVTLSGASTAGPLVGTGANDIVSLTFTPSAGSLTLTVSGTVNDAQLNTGATRGAYQNVVSAFDITESGQRDCFGVRADGTDDGYQTANINFSNTPAITVFAAVRKLSDAATGILCELTTSIDSNNGAFALTSPSALGANSYRFSSKGTSIANAGTGVFAAAPDTAVLTGIANISNDIATLRRNGVVVETSASDQGTGNFSNAVLHLFRRGGTSLPFNGNLYALIVAGGSYPLSTIQRVERILSSITPTVNL
jgi:hypothetical protein